MSWNSESLCWQELAKSIKDSSGKVALVSEKSKTCLLLVDFNNYVFRFSNESKVLVFNQPDKSPNIRATYIDIKNLQPISGINKIIQKMKEEKHMVFYESGEETKFLFKSSLKKGRNTYEFPKEVRHLPEILILAEANEEVSRTIYALNPSENSIEVIPQDWFNNAKDIDFGYQWITRAVRDPETGRIYGDGIRLGAFLLDNTGTQVEHWFKADPFYGPGSTR